MCWPKASSHYERRCVGKSLREMRKGHHSQFTVLPSRILATRAREPWQQLTIMTPATARTSNPLYMASLKRCRTVTRGNSIRHRNSWRTRFTANDLTGMVLGENFLSQRPGRLWATWDQTNDDILYKEHLCSKSLHIFRKLIGRTREPWFLRLRGCIWWDKHRFGSNLFCHVLCSLGKFMSVLWALVFSPWKKYNRTYS